MSVDIAHPSVGTLCAQLFMVNCHLWHEEDKARSTNDAEVARAKREIDKLNQKRNDLIEQIDEAMLHFAPSMQHGLALDYYKNGEWIEQTEMFTQKEVTMGMHRVRLVERTHG